MHRDIPAVLRQAERDGASETARGARHEGDFGGGGLLRRGVLRHICLCFYLSVDVISVDANLLNRGAGCVPGRADSLQCRNVSSYT